MNEGMENPPQKIIEETPNPPLPTKETNFYDNKPIPLLSNQPISMRRIVQRVGPLFEVVTETWCNPNPKIHPQIPEYLYIYLENVLKQPNVATMENLSKFAFLYIPEREFVAHYEWREFAYNSFILPPFRETDIYTKRENLRKIKNHVKDSQEPQNQLAIINFTDYWICGLNAYQIQSLLAKAQPMITKSKIKELLVMLFGYWTINESGLETIPKFINEVSTPYLETIRISISSYKLNPNILFSLISSVKDRIFENNKKTQKKLETFSFFIETKVIKDKCFFELADILTNLKDLKFLKLFLSEISLASDFKQTNFFTALQQIVPKLTIFVLCFAFSETEVTTKEAIESFELLNKTIVENIHGGMKIFSLTIKSKSFDVDSMSHYIYDKLTYKRITEQMHYVNLMYIDIYLFGLEKLNSSKIEDNNMSLERQILLKKELNKFIRFKINGND